MILQKKIIFLYNKLKKIISIKKFLGQISTKSKYLEFVFLKRKKKTEILKDVFEPKL